MKSPVAASHVNGITSICDSLSDLEMEQESQDNEDTDDEEEV